MSYGILYRKAFIKVDDNLIIPVLESGDNNVYDVCGRGREKRSRDWYNHKFHTKGAFMIDKNDLLKNIEYNRLEVKSREEDYKDESFGWFTSVSLYGKHTSTTSFNDYRNFFLNGIKKGKTIEEYLLYDVKFSLRVYKYDFEKYTSETGIERLKDVIFQSTEHMLQSIAEYSDFYKGTDVLLYIRVVNDFALENITRELKKARVKKEKKVLTNNFYVLCSVVSGGYFIKLTKYSYKYTNYINGFVKKFETEKQAQNFHSKMRSSESFEIKYIDK